MPLKSDPIDLTLTDGDIDLTGGRLSFTSGIGAVAQGIRIRLQAFRGEWFRNLDSGVPYWQELLGQKFDEAKARRIFREAIRAAPGVGEILKLAVTFDAKTRTLSVTWQVRTEFGDSDTETTEVL